MKITIGETSINYIAKNIDLKVVKDSTERLICNSSICGVKECDVRETVLSDGTNNYYKVIFWISSRRIVICKIIYWINYSVSMVVNPIFLYNVCVRMNLWEKRLLL